MGFFDWLRRPGARRTVDHDSLADRLAMDTVNRVLPLFASKPDAFAPARREAVYLLSTIVFFCLVLHPRFDERTAHGFFNRFLTYIDAYGNEAKLWPTMSPSFLSMMFPDRMEAYLDAIGNPDPTESAQLRTALRGAAELVANHLESELRLPAQLVGQLEAIASDQLGETFDALG